MTWLQKSNTSRKASQGGLTPPKLYDSGLDFPNRGRKTRKRRQVRISCKNVTNGLSSVVFMSHPNQLPICHTSRFVESQVLQKCFRESVAEMSLWQECHTSRFVGCQVAKMSLLQKCHTWVRIGPIAPESPLRPPAWENDPSVGNSPVGISLAPVGIKSGWPHGGKWLEWFVEVKTP